MRRKRRESNSDIRSRDFRHGGKWRRAWRRYKMFNARPMRLDRRGKQCPSPAEEGRMRGTVGRGRVARGEKMRRRTGGSRFRESRRERGRARERSDLSRAVSIVEMSWTSTGKKEQWRRRRTKRTRPLPRSAWWRRGSVVERGGFDGCKSARRLLAVKMSQVFCGTRVVLPHVVKGRVHAVRAYENSDRLGANDVSRRSGS